MDIEEYERLKGLAEAKVKEADEHIIGDLTFVGIGLALEAQVYATLAEAEASRPAPSRHAVSTIPLNVTDTGKPSSQPRGPVSCDP